MAKRHHSGSSPYPAQHDRGAMGYKPSSGHAANLNPGRFAHAEYGDIDRRRKTEYRDGEMLNEDRNAIANMPQHVKMMEYPHPVHYMPENLDDGIRGVDSQIAADGMAMRRNMYPKKV